MKRIYRTPGRQGGFSLIEVMIAVVVLATGLLALAALQASLAKSSGEAKVRSRVAALLSARMDELRVLQYDSAATVANDSCAATVWVPATFCAEAGLGALTATQTVSLWSSAVDAATFTEGRVPAAGEPQFKRVTLTATWADSDNASHSLAMTSEISALALGSSILPQPPGSGTPTGAPIVRTDNPAAPGVIPIAIGGGDATAASNPRPEVIGKNNNQSAVGTRFDVLTYSGLTGEAVIQRRVETSAIKCECQYGAGGTNLPEIYRVAQWPAVWTGERYEVYKPDSPTSAPGNSFASGPKAGVEQSALCQECCRDHHDTTTVDVPKFDPERVVTLNQSHAHYSPNGAGTLVTVPNTATSDYVESCRLIRVDGFWRTAADTYSRHLGLLETQAVATVPAKTGVPSDAASLKYQAFVKDYLGQYTGTVATAPANANDLFNQEARGLNNPLSISISRPSPKDERYLHGRGVYVDYLEKAAREKIMAVVEKCPTEGDQAECMLPFLPFATINVTELAFWEPMVGDAVNRSTLSVATGSSLIFDPFQPTRGRTNALASASGAATADAVATIGLSNSGLAVAAGVDVDDEQDELSDRQVFVVSGAATPGAGQTFLTRIVSGLPQVLDASTTNDPAIAWAVGTDAGNCLSTTAKKDPNPNDYVCSTSGALGVAGSITLARYFRVEEVATPSYSATCNGSSATATVSVPTFTNYRVSAASIGGVAGSIGTAIANGKSAESTTVQFSSIPANGSIDVTFASEGTIVATIKSCDTNPGGNQIKNIIWNYPWEAL